MVSIKTTYRERFNILNDNKVNCKTYSTILGRSSVSDLNKMIQARLDECDDMLFNCLTENITLVGLFSDEVNNMIVEFNSRTDLIRTEVTSKEDVLKMQREYMERLNSVVSLQGLDVRVEQSLHDVIKSVISVINHISFICNHCSYRTGNTMYKSKEKILTRKLLSKLDFCIDYILDEFFETCRFMFGHFNEVLNDILKEKGFEDSLRFLTSELDEHFERNRIDRTSRFRSRDLNRLAKRNGYKKVRQTGDHGIFKCENGSILVIPQGRRVGKGLSIKIQKSIIS